MAKDRTACILSGLIAVMLAGPAGAVSYYVSTSGSDRDDGTLGAPFRTIQKAADVAQAGDTVYVRAGMYRETVTITHAGSAGQPITFQPYPGEDVTITGLDPVPADLWMVYQGTIYQAALGGTQVFINGRMVNEARYPSVGYNNPLHAPFNTIDSVSIQAPPAVSTITDAALTGTSWTGARIAIIPGGQWTQYYASHALIDSQNGTTLSFRWTAPGIPPTYPDMDPQTGNRYYLYGSPAALNSPNEWAYDPAVGKLLLQVPAGMDLAAQTVEIRRREMGLTLAGTAAYCRICGFRLMAANVAISGDNNRIENCQILYPAVYSDPCAAWGLGGVVISGQGNTISHCEVGYSWGDGVTLTGSNNTIDNNIIHDVNWSGTEGAFVNAGFTSEGTVSNTIITNNTMYNSGRHGILLGNYSNTPNTQVRNNDISRYGALVQDKGGIYTFYAADAGTVITCNRVRDARGPGVNGGIYLDDSSADIMVHHNLVTDVSVGIYIKGDSHVVANNTLWNVTYATTTATEGYTNATTKNNLSNNGHWEGDIVSNNRYQTANQFTNSAIGDYTLTANSSGWLYGPTYKRAVDYGTVIPGITDGYVGAAPDAGAFERGAPAWTAGADWRTWTAGNQHVAPLTSAVGLRDDGGSSPSPLRVGQAASGDTHNYRSFLKFDLSGVSRPIARAVLRIYECAPPDGAVGDVTLHCLTAAPSGGAFAYDQPAGPGRADWYDPANLDLYTEIDITDYVRGWLADPATNHGLSLRSNSEFVAGSAKSWDGFYGVTAPQLLITLPQPTVILDRMHWDSPANLWSESSGSYWTMDVSSYCRDPNDDESPAIGLQRTGAFYFGYRADAGKIFSTVEVALATHGTIEVPDGSDRAVLSWASEGGALTVLAPAAVTYVGQTAAAGWHQYVFQYNLGGLNADQVRITATDYRDYSPFFSSVKISVLAPAPVTVQGTVVLEGFVGDNTSAAVKLTFRPGTGDSFTRTAVLGTAGTLRVDDVPPGDYTLTVRTAGWLAATRNITVSDDPTVLDPIVLQGADNNGDDQISFEDFSVLQNGYGQRGAAGNPLPMAAPVANGCGLVGVLVLSFVFLAFVFLYCRCCEDSFYRKEEK